MHAHLVVVGLLFFWPLVGFDPAPVRVPHPARVGLLLSGAAAARAPGRDADGRRARRSAGAAAVRLALAAGADPVAEQRLGAGILWVAGDLVALVAVAVAAYRWWRADTAFSRTGPSASMAAAP